MDQIFTAAPPLTEVMRLVGSNPIMHARYYQAIVSAFLNLLVRGLVVGPIRAHAGMTETQGRGLLHLHLLVWALNAPSSISDFRERLSANAAEFLSKLAEYLSQVAPRTLGVSAEDLHCVSCKKAGSLDVEFPSAAYRLRLDRAPQTTTCRNCKATGTTDDAIKSGLLQQVDAKVQYSDTFPEVARELAWQRSDLITDEGTLTQKGKMVLY